MRPGGKGAGRDITFAAGGRELRAYWASPARGSGPGIVVLPDGAGANAPIRRLCDTLAEEGYVALAPDLRAAPDADSALPLVEAAIAALRKIEHHAGKVGVIGFGGGGLRAYLAATRGAVDCAVAYDADGLEGRLADATTLRVPFTLHEGGRASPSPAMRAIRDAFRGRGPAAIFAYPECARGFATPGGAAFAAASAGIAYSRTIAALKRVMGPHYDLEELWDHHLACEFALQDSAAAMQTMVAEPYVNHVPTLTGGTGHAQLLRFYENHFVHQVPRDRKTIPISRTVGADRIVDEKIFCFTHDAPIDWLLPGVPPTGKYVEIPIVGIVTFRGDKLVNEHIYWDQASVLVQIGLLDPRGLPVSGREQARKLLDPARPSTGLVSPSSAGAG